MNPISLSRSSTLYYFVTQYGGCYEEPTDLCHLGRLLLEGMMTVSIIIVAIVGALTGPLYIVVGLLTHYYEGDGFIIGVATFAVIGILLLFAYLSNLWVHRTLPRQQSVLKQVILARLRKYCSPIVITE